MKKFCALLFVFLIASTLYPAITNSGVMTFNGGSAWGDFIIEEPGLLIAQKTKLYALTIMGKADLDECTVEREVILFGKFIAKNTTFKTDVICCSGLTEFESCIIPNLTISNGDGSELEIFLKGNCIISGDIFFENGSAIIHKGQDVVILGDVIGGSVIEE